MRKVLVLVLAGLLLLPTGASATYAPAGVYLDALDWTPFAVRTDIRFDATGIPQVRRGTEYVYNPVVVSQYGLREWSLWATDGGEEHRDAAVRAAEWLVTNQDPATGAWHYEFEFPVSGMDVTLPAPWISAMAQGQAMSLLTRVWRSTGSAHYLAAAEAALAPFRASVADGGVVAAFLGDDTLPYYEEYPTTPASLALNGFMFSLLGLYDLAGASPGSDAGTRFATGLETLKAALPYYDTGGISAYHLGHLTNPPRPVHASLKYHWIHVTELDALISVAPDPTLELYRDRWAAYEPPPPPPPPRPRTVERPPPAPAPTVAEPYVSHLRLARTVRARTRKLILRFELSAPATVAIRLSVRRGGRWRERAARSLALASGTHTVHVRRRDGARFGRRTYQVRLSTRSSASRLRVSASTSPSRRSRSA